MSHLNMNIVLCKEFDEDTQSIHGMMNEIKLSNQIDKEKIELNIFTLVSGFGGNASDQMKFDYYLICTKDLDRVEKDYTQSASYMFSMTMSKVEKGNDESSDDAGEPIYKNTFQSMTCWNRKVVSPCAGQFEIHVYENVSNQDVESAMERLENYMQEGQEPVTVYHFNVKK